MIQLTNSGNAALTITSVSIAGANASSFTQTNNCPASLGATDACVVNVTFAASAASLAATLHIHRQRVGVAADGQPDRHRAGSGSHGQSDSCVADIRQHSGRRLGHCAVRHDQEHRDGRTTISGISITGANASSYSQTNTCGRACHRSLLHRVRHLHSDDLRHVDGVAQHRRQRFWHAANSRSQWDRNGSRIVHALGRRGHCGSRL